MSDKRLLICDLDNTLYDWVGYFVPAFYAMVDRAVEIVGCDREKLLDDFRAVHQQRRDSEEPFALLETKTIKDQFCGVPKDELLKLLDPAFHAFNSERKKSLVLYPSVRETLERLNSLGVRIIAHTESKLYGAVDRLNRLDLFPYFSKVYCRERSQSPHPVPALGVEWMERIPAGKLVELSHHQAKPDPSVLSEICTRERFSAYEVAYVGDSLARDILMAKRANVFSIWAAYGAQHNAELYRKLIRVSHWTAAEVTQELQFQEEAKTVEPDCIAHETFSEVLTGLEIQPAFHSALN